MVTVVVADTTSVIVAGRNGLTSSQSSSRRTPPQPIDRVWPDAPAPARIRYIRSLTPAAAARPGVFRRIWEVVSGGRDQPVMAQPYGMDVGPLDRLYVADAAGGAVHVYELRTGRYTKLNVDAEALIDVAVLGDRLFVTDSVGARVLCLDSRGRRIWTRGREDGFERPTGIVGAGNRLHVVDTLGHRIVTLSPEGRVLGTFGSRGGEPGQLNFPTNIARDREGLLYVSDSMNFRVQIFSADGRYRSSFGRLGDGSGDLNRPKGIAVDSDGHIYVVEGFHDVVQIFERDGQFLLAFGEPGHGEGEFWLATGIHIHDDRIYVADSANGRVQEFEYLKERP
jgi:DNA-binding beta-propeller fold protein YncE